MTKRFWAECIGGCGGIHDDCDQINDERGQTKHR